ncbi:SDR family NAD(P)-dependent oxidoreductase [Pectinatus frisingensis]|uniref:SDR family NAD(P)-dependent oxidoreductase n=1 Tax=Pectinatus frisingensis TaxID=865 RepID=UPI0018C46E14|nr:SDR family NAD(P)-dependent oxidoreductase [Pectinatus frisingensis]
MKTVIITGGTSGIGLATARLYLENGDRVIAIGRSQEKYEMAATALKKFTAQYHFIAADVKECGQCREAVRQIEKNFIQVDILINSAGMYQEKPIDEVGEADFNEMMGINIKGTYFMCKYVLPLLKKSRQNPAIVNISSDAGINGNYFCTLYCAAKGAVTVFSKALALELAGFKIRVNCVCPGDIDTPLTRAQFAGNEAAAKAAAELYPLGRIGTAQEAADVIYFLASEKASFVTGAVWSVDGGLTSC